MLTTRFNSKRKEDLVSKIISNLRNNTLKIRTSLGDPILIPNDAIIKIGKIELKQDVYELYNDSTEAEDYVLKCTEGYNDLLKNYRELSLLKPKLDLMPLHNKEKNQFYKITQFNEIIDNFHEKSRIKARVIKQAYNDITVPIQITFNGNIIDTKLQSYHAVEDEILSKNTDIIRQTKNLEFQIIHKRSPIILNANHYNRQLLVSAYANLANETLKLQLTENTDKKILSEIKKQPKITASDAQKILEQMTYERDLIATLSIYCWMKQREKFETNDLYKWLNKKIRIDKESKQIAESVMRYGPKKIILYYLENEWDIKRLMYKKY